MDRTFTLQQVLQTFVKDELRMEEGSCIARCRIPGARRPGRRRSAVVAKFARFKQREAVRFADHTDHGETQLGVKGQYLHGELCIQS